MEPDSSFVNRAKAGDVARCLVDPSDRVRCFESTERGGDDDDTTKERRGTMMIRRRTLRQQLAKRTTALISQRRPENGLIIPCC